MAQLVSELKSLDQPVAKLLVGRLKPVAHQTLAQSGHCISQRGQVERHRIKPLGPVELGPGARVRQVAQTMSRGLTDEGLFVTIKTVETHRRNIMAKLDLDNVAQLTKYAIREGITSL